MIYNYVIFRAIDVHALIGNVGGYIGLCLGYSLLHVPKLIEENYMKLQSYYVKG